MAAAALLPGTSQLQGRFPSSLPHPLPYQFSFPQHQLSHANCIGYFSALICRSSRRDKRNPNAWSWKCGVHSSMEHERDIPTGRKNLITETQNQKQNFMNTQISERSGWRQKTRKVQGITNGSVEDSPRQQGRDSEAARLSQLLHRMVETGEFERAFMLLEDIVARGHVPRIPLCTRFIIGLFKDGRAENVSRVLKIMSMSGCMLDEIAYCVLINGFCRAGYVDSAIQLLSEMKERGFPRNLITYNNILRGLCNQGDLERASEILDQLLQDGLVPNVYTYNLFIDVVCKEYGVDEATRLLDEMITKGCIPNIVTYNIFLRGLCKEGRLDDAVQFLNNLPLTGCQPSVVSHSTLFNALCNAGRWDDAAQVLADMHNTGCPLNAVTYNMLIHSLRQSEHLTDAIDILENMLKECIPELDGTSFNAITVYISLLKGLCRLGMVDEALEMLKKMKNTNYRPDVDAYNTVIHFLCEAHRTDQAIDMLYDMVGEGCKPNETTYITLIRGLASEGWTNQATELYHELAARGVFRTYSFVHITKTHPKLTELAEKV
ncbi:hypothetical protein KI387_024456 [Taxus chinensis]|uniref:Pentatricopeptide repeat-containing protein n=1 Tax=Taxus chinensis TaxID=29808 RepID=A0AA38L8J4_TAXCH|nr:hypothetical protein KI387_024456 [Taxus chinensis]